MALLRGAQGKTKRKQAHGVARGRPSEHKEKILPHGGSTALAHSDISVLRVVQSSAGNPQSRFQVRSASSGQLGYRPAKVWPLPASICL